MKHFKRSLALFLSVIMIVATVVGTATVFAGDNPGPHIGITASATSVKVGEEFTVTLSLNAMKVSSFTAGIDYDKDNFDYVSYAPYDGEAPGVVYVESNSKYPTEMNVEERQGKNGVGFHFEGTSDKTYKAQDFVTLTLKAKAAGDLTIKLYEHCSGEDKYDSDDITGVTITVVDEVDSIAVTTPPTQTIYHAGDSFNPAGMVVTATMKSGATQAVTGYTVSPEGGLTEGTQNVTVTYEGKTATQAVTVKPAGNHVYGTDHKCTICGAEEPSIKVTAGSEYVIYESDIKSATSAEGTEGTPWTDKNGNIYVGKFYKLSSILESKGISTSGAHGVVAVASDGFKTGFAAEDIENVYIYDMTEVKKNGSVQEVSVGTSKFGTAVNGAAGSKWAKNVATVSVASECTMFVKKGSCKHYCAICGKSEAIKAGTSPVWTWAEDYSSCTVKLTYACGATVTYDATITESDRVEPSCAKAGKVTYTATYVESDGKTTYTDQKKDVQIPATQHSYDYSKPVWTWDNETVWDGTATAKVTFTCTKCTASEPDHTVTYVADVTKNVVQPTCEEKGKTTYTAKYTVGTTEITDTKTVEKDALEHDYKGEASEITPTWTWTDDCSQAVAKFACTRSGCTHYETETAAGSKITKKITQEATATVKGKAEYTAEVEFQGKKYTATKTLEFAIEGKAEVKQQLVVSQSLKDAGIADEAALKEALNKKTVEIVKENQTKNPAAEGKKFTDAVTKIMEIDLLVSKNNGKDYAVATKDDIPAEGIKMLIKYSDIGDGLDSSYVYTAVHMVSDGDKAGQTENLSVTNTKEGIEITVTSASPFAISYYKAVADESKDVKPGVNTNDNNNTMLWFILAAACLVVACGTVVYRKRKSN